MPGQKSLADDVFSLSSAVRYCAVIDHNGKVIEGGMRKGTKSLEPSSLGPKLITQLSILLGTDKGWDEYMGQTDYFLIHKGKVNLALFPIKGMKGVLVTTELSFSAAKMDSIRKVIDKHVKN